MEAYVAPKLAEDAMPKLFGDSRHYSRTFTLEDLWADEDLEQSKRARGWG
jgi:hypothetical protein